MLNATIEHFSYKKFWCEKLDKFEFVDVNALPAKSLVKVGGKSLALSKWVSPKRTRSYPYARVYDTLQQDATKTVTVIPLFKDEGSGGEMDYLQWDTVGLMSLLNVYVILAFYDEAERKNDGKITNQKFNNDFVYLKLNEVVNYQQSALHWNLGQFEKANLLNLVENAKNAYRKVGQNLAVKMHNFANLEKFCAKILGERENFIAFSRKKAQNAQNAESKTTQPKEFLNFCGFGGQKEKIVIKNHLGGEYFFTIDEVFFKDGVLFLCENKHAKNAALPSFDDIKDGLLKLMLYENLSELKGFDKFKAVLNLTASGKILTAKQREFLALLKEEARFNKFEIWLNGVVR